jgi:predicted membrane metal-binding protein
VSYDPRFYLIWAQYFGIAVAIFLLVSAIIVTFLVVPRAFFLLLIPFVFIGWLIYLTYSIAKEKREHERLQHKNLVDILKGEKN